MSDIRKFRVDYPTGYVEINVGEFFGNADQKRAKKLLRLARENCTETQRCELLAMLEAEDKERTEVLDAVGELEFQRRNLLARFIRFEATERPLGSPEKRLVRERAKIRQIAMLLSKERWTG